MHFFETRNPTMISMFYKEVIWYDFFLSREYDDISFDVNSGRYSQYYLLADDIYLKWSIFVQSIKDPQGETKKHFADKH